MCHHTLFHKSMFNLWSSRHPVFHNSCAALCPHQLHTRALVAPLPPGIYLPPRQSLSPFLSSFSPISHTPPSLLSLSYLSVCLSLSQYYHADGYEVVSLISKSNLILACCYTFFLPLHLLGFLRHPVDDMEFPKHKELRRLNSPELGIGLFVYTTEHSQLKPELSLFPASWLPAHASIQSPKLKQT